MNTSFIPLEILSIATSFSSRTGYSIVLKEIGGDRKLQMIVGSNEAQNIAISVERIVTSRPMTHGFIQSLINEYSISLKYILIYKFEQGVYYAHALFEDAFGTQKIIDCRPSDAICLALKMEKPILAVPEVFDESSIRYLDLVEDSKESKDNDYSKYDVARLKKQLKEAIDNEQFELAAIIQSELNRR